MRKNTKILIDGLTCLPGSKRKNKYKILLPLEHQTVITEPFQGALSRSLILSQEYPGKYSVVSGEVNLSMRDLARIAIDEPSLFIEEYNNARDYLLKGINQFELVTFAKQKNLVKAQEVFRKQFPKTSELLDRRWEKLVKVLYEYNQDKIPKTGVYNFVQRSCFGNVVRLSPKQPSFNIKWHILKLANAILFSPSEWTTRLNKINWNPTTNPDYISTIDSVEDPINSYLLLDPPYIDSEDTKQMTPCYPNHYCTGSAREYTYNLAIDSLERGFKKGFPLIHACNYYSLDLFNDFSELADNYGYKMTFYDMGKCAALGNSNGRYIHGERVDTRSENIEFIYKFKSKFY